MLIPLEDATRDRCGPKAGTLGALLRSGYPVPDGVVVPGEARAHVTAAVRAEIAARLDPEMAYAVRSSAADEDLGEASGAGRYVSVLGARGVSAVASAIEECRGSAVSQDSLATASPSALIASTVPVRPSGAESEMAVLIQPLVPTEVSGVMFVPAGSAAETGAVGASGDDSVRIEASWGLGPSIVGGLVTPDAFTVSFDGAIATVIGDKALRLDPGEDGTVKTEVDETDRHRPALADDRVRELAELGRAIARTLGGGQDIEWALGPHGFAVLQARPITAALPDPLPEDPQKTRGSAGIEDPFRSGRRARSGPSVPGPDVEEEATGLPPRREDASGTGTGTGTTLHGTPGSRGTATGQARVVRGVADFARVRPGDILVCHYTDPAWTPLFGVAGGIVTETGGVLSHAAIVAREHGIPAVLGVRDAMRSIHDGSPIVIDGNTGVVS